MARKAAVKVDGLSAGAQDQLKALRAAKGNVQEQGGLTFIRDREGTQAMCELLVGNERLEVRGLSLEDICPEGTRITKSQDRSTIWLNYEDGSKRTLTIADVE